MDPTSITIGCVIWIAVLVAFNAIEDKRDGTFWGPLGFAVAPVVAFAAAIFVP